MKVRVCPKCSKEFTKKSNYEYHVNRKIPCVKLNSSENEQNFSNNESNPSNLSFQDLIQQLQSQIRAQNEQIQALKNEIVNNNSQHFSHIKDAEISNNVSQNNVNLNLANFGDEEFSKLVPAEIFKILDSKYGSFTNYVKFTHINDRIPEQKNVHYTNISSRNCKVIEGGGWVTRDIDEVVEEIINNGISNIETYMEENDIRVSSKSIEKLRDLIEKMQNDDKEDKKFVKRIKTNIKRLLYDNKKKIKN